MWPHGKLAISNYSSALLSICFQVIGVGRFRIFMGGARFRILGGQGGGAQIRSRHMASY